MDRIHLRHLRNLRTVIGVTLLLNVICCTGATGAPPAVKHFFPPGAQRGITTQVTAAGELPVWPVQSWTSESGLVVTCGEEKGKLAVTTPPDIRPGVYFIRLYDDEGATRPLPFVVGNLREFVENASNDSPDKAEALPSSMVTVNGRLEKRDDVDVYAVELTDGQTLVASIVANEKLASPMDGVLQILTAGGSVLEQNDDWHGLDPQLMFTAPSTGKYLVRIFAFPAQPDSRIGLAGGEDYLYRLTVTTGPFVDYTWPLAVRQHENTDVQMIGWNLVEPANQRSITAAARSCSIDGDQFAGQLSVAAEPHPCLMEVEPNGLGKPQVLDLPTTISGRLHAPSDTDAFQFQAQRGETILFQLDGRDLGSPLDAVVEVIDSSGKSLVRTDDTNRRRDPELSWKVPDDGVFQVVVSDLHGRGGERFFYSLRAMQARPDFRITSTEHAFTGNVGKPLEITLEVDRQHGFDREIIVRTEGLPDSVVAEPATSAKDGDAAKKVKLRLTAGTAYPGPLRIIGVAQGPDSLSRVAVSKLAGDAEIADLWLTFKAAESE